MVYYDRGEITRRAWASKLQRGEAEKGKRKEKGGSPKGNKNGRCNGMLHDMA